MFDFLKKIIKTKHEKDIQRLKPIVAKINEYFEQFDSLSDDELRAKTQEFRELIQSRIQELEAKKEQLSERLKNEVLTPSEVADIREEIKKLDKEIFQTVEETLDEILPQAYAVVKQACKRLKERGYAYTYTGQHYVWDMVPFDVQLMGAIVLHEGKIAEMATGEGKTLVAVMPLYLNSLAGKGCHLVTVNDYLARRDAEWMKPVYDFLGVTVGVIQSNMTTEQRQKEYNCDITYGTNNEFGFDYLRDNMVIDAKDIVQRGHWYAIVDEVDSVLIDEARTPLIISGPVEHTTDEIYQEMEPRVRRMVEAQTKLVNQIVSEAQKLLESGSKEDREAAGVLLLRAYRGLPKHKRLTKLLQEPEYLKLLKETELLYLRDQGQRMHEIDDELYYTIDEKNHNVDITEKGRQMLCTAQEDPNMFVIPDIATELSQIEGDSSLSPEEKQKKKDELYVLYSERSEKIHAINQLLVAFSLYEKDVEYVVQDGKVLIVDEFTGRILEGRRYSEGLHQAIEAKEHVRVERDTQTLATITIQNYFRIYKKLAGMTGTAETEAAEFEKIYGLDVVVIPTNKPVIRIDKDDLIFRTKREKYNAIIEAIEEELKKGRAVLVGTTSVEVSELLSKMLRRKGIPHNVLNAKHHQREAEIIAQAGRKGTVTIATNMAGRGTDIKIDHEVRKNGGLAIIGSERHEARRIDRQLRGRAGRQGDPGTSQFFISLEDDLMRLFGGERIANIMQKLKIPEGEPIFHPMITKNVEKAQKKVEENNFGIRKRLLEYDNVMNQQREVIYARRRNALTGERLRPEIFEYIEDLAYDWYDEFHPDLKVEEFKNVVRSTLLCELNLTKEEFESLKKEEVIQKVLDAAKEFYDRKEQFLGTEFMAQLERIATLQIIDDKWREHLREMDDLREGIHLRSYGQKDPLLEYKAEAYKLFVNLIKTINRDIVRFVFRYFPPVIEKEVRAVGRARKDLPTLRRVMPDQSSLQFSHSSTLPQFLVAPFAQQQQQAQGDVTAVKTYRKTEKEIGRNDPCPCGSGKKYKHCHGKKVSTNA
ncbi:preprotein translocase subunit SecA [Bacteroidetes/Chlorobi group bacterium Naka2016]|jgi:preprotein translocase subunit SecA|nr:MAG: preprotein translocase subunit SecA [Bacteroidetes/Chlorobi group bacterium Naka2016]